MRIKCPNCGSTIDAQSMGPRMTIVKSQAGVMEVPTDGGKDEMVAFNCPNCHARSSDASIIGLTVVER